MSKDEIYIPVSLEDAMNHLDETVTKDNKNYIKGIPSDEVYGHLGIGMWIRNNWGFWTQDSKLFEWFTNLGLHHPDDMSNIILNSFRARLKEEPFDLDAEVNRYIQYWKHLEK